jgi:nicotinate-nucleotide adenylyltransferase
MKIGLFGGSFDPIHRGHIEPVKQARRALGLDQVIYLPTARAPHKRGGAQAPALARYAMVELALLAEPGLVVSPHELTPERPAYTIDTLEHFQRQLPQAELHLILGGDSFVDLPQWVRSADIVAAARLVVLARPGFPLAGRKTGQPGALPPAVAALAASDRVHVLTQTQVEVSSTRVRELLARGESLPPGWLPGLVVEFIQKYSLYR